MRTLKQYQEEAREKLDEECVCEQSECVRKRNKTLDSLISTLIREVSEAMILEKSNESNMSSLDEEEQETFSKEDVEFGITTGWNSAVSEQRARQKQILG